MARKSAAKDWPAYQVSARRLDKLKPFDRNARTHSEEQVAEIVASIGEFGWTNPALVDETGMVIAGHGRRLAALKIYEDGGSIRLPDGRELPVGTIPVIDCSGWSDAQKRAYVLADNQIALNAGWDMDLLRDELAGLQREGFDLSLAGFSEDQLAAALGGSEGVTDPDDVPEPPAIPVSALGDVWLLGSHRIICGDSTDADCVAKVLAGVKPHLMVTDPPYGVEYDANWRNVAKRPDGTPYGASAIGKVDNDGQSDWREAWVLFPGDVAYVWHAGVYAGEVSESLKACEFEMRSQIIWAKNTHAISRGHYHWQHEPCWYAVKKGGTGHWVGDRSQMTLWPIDKPMKSETGHSTQKPVECMKRPIENNSKPGQAVYEPFSGSGTTIIAGEMTGRVVYAIELNPAYVDVAVTRWQSFTGEQATLEGDGRTFDMIAAERSRVVEAAE
ncbi:site-specific DNA-methyltransferase [Mesorhizobium sp. M0514]|uniref:site-specific DNA-methyltransferase n=1 Tax=Mesorhizobium sp. M0514 TaxID=2956955 RepID=UPI0033355CF0